MKHYELVVVFDTNHSAADIQATKAKVEGLLSAGTILATDDIGLMNTAYPIEGQMQAYYVSYHITIEFDAIADIKQELRIMKGVNRSFFYAMSANESFLTLSECSKRFEDMLPKEEEVEEEEAAKEESEQEAEE